VKRDDGAEASAGDGHAHLRPGRSGGPRNQLDNDLEPIQVELEKLRRRPCRSPRSAGTSHLEAPRGELAREGHTGPR